MPGIGPVPVLNAGFLQIGLSAFTMHDQAVPPVPPVPGVPGLIEGPAFMGWPPGAISHKTALTVLRDGNPTVQQGHDIGYVIPHFAIPMNSLCALHTMLSKHKVPFPVSHLHVGGKSAGTYVWFLMGEICANPVSMPSAVVILLKCTVWTSMTWTDLFIGLVVCAMDAASALPHAEILERTKPGDIRFSALLVGCRFKLSQYDQVIETLQGAPYLFDMTGGEALQILLGRSFFEKGQWDVAAEVLRKLPVTSNRTDWFVVEAQYWLGCAHLNAGRKEDAKRWLTKVYAQNIDHRDVQVRLKEAQS
jgi:hypothetical protein